MFIQVEETPNPATLKFLPGQTVLAEGTAEFVAGGDHSGSPLAQRIFSIDGIKSAFFSNDFISVTKDDTRDWSLLKPMVLAAIMDHFVSGMPVMEIAAERVSRTMPEDELSLQIMAIIDDRVRPAVAADGGDIIFDRFEDGVVYLHMRGACSGCPSSAITLKNGIENMLKHFVPEVTEVRAVEGE
ncbi:MAG: NifU family protein [Bdellovibrionales bacterium]